MKRLIALTLGLALVGTLAVSTVQAADREVYVEATHSLDTSNFEFNTSNLHFTGVYRNSIWKGIGIDFSATGAVAQSYEKAIITIGPRYTNGNFEASLTSSFAVNSTEDFGDSAMARLRYNF